MNKKHFTDLIQTRMLIQVTALIDLLSVCETPDWLRVLETA